MIKIRTTTWKAEMASDPIGGLICEQKADERHERWGIHGGLDYRAKKHNPALCNHGHRIADLIHTDRGKYIRCGTCDRERNMAAKKSAREEAA